MGDHRPDAGGETCGCGAALKAPATQRLCRYCWERSNERLEAAQFKRPSEALLDRFEEAARRSQSSRD